MRLFKNNRRKQDDLFQRLLREHDRRQRKKAIHNFLSSTKWYGIGPIVSSATLIVTIILTIYIFNLGREQNIAHLEYTVFNRLLDSSVTKIKQSVVIENHGPAIGKGVLIVIVSANTLTCSGENVAGPGEAGEPSKIVSEPHRCEFFYDSLYPGYTIRISYEIIPRGLNAILRSDRNNDGIVDTFIDTTNRLYISGENVPTSSSSLRADFPIP